MKAEVRRFLPELLAMQRHKKRWFKPQLREFLREPVKAYNVPNTETVEGRKAIAQMHNDRIEAMFALYDIPVDWPAETQWLQLAMCLAGEHFQGCRTLQKGRGGRPEHKRLREKDEMKRALAAEFRIYVSAHPKLTRTRAAELFLNQNLTRCRRAGIHKPRSLANAMRYALKECCSETEVMGS